MKKLILAVVVLLSMVVLNAEAARISKQRVLFEPVSVVLVDAGGVSHLQESSVTSVKSRVDNCVSRYLQDKQQHDQVKAWCRARVLNGEISLHF